LESMWHGRVPHVVEGAAQVWRVRAYALNRHRESVVLNRHRHLHTGNATIDQVTEHPAPRFETFGGAGPQAEMLPVAVLIDADHPQHRRRAYAALAAQLFVVCVDDQVSVPL